MSILQTTDLKKYYGTEPNITKALDGVTLSIEDGEFVAIVGTSGSGKSTLLNMMGGLDTPTSGSIKVKRTIQIQRRTTYDLPQAQHWFYLPELQSCPRPECLRKHCPAGGVGR